MEAILSSLSQAPNHYRLRLRHVTDAGEQVHYHDCYQVLYVLSGRMVHGKSQDQVILEPGDAFIVPPGYVHHTRALEQQDLTYYSLSFLESLFSPGFVTSPVHSFLSGLRLNTLLKEQQDVRLRVRLSGSERRQMERLLECLLDEFAEDRTMEATMASHLVAAILRILARSYETGKVPEKQDPIQECIRYIDANYMLDLSLEDLAKQAALSRSALVQQFSQQTGMPVKQYLHERRIRLAKKLCAVENVPVREIAALVGYQDFSTFFRNFKKRTGVSPAAYREQLKHGNGADD